MQHTISVGRKQRGSGALAGSGMTYGTSGSCSCLNWTFSVNIAPSKGGRQQVEAAHEEHVAKQTADGDLELLQGLMRRVAKTLSEDIESEWILGVRSAAKRLLELADEHDETMKIALAELTAKED